jgi:hypothetical protein
MDWAPEAQRPRIDDSEPPDDAARPSTNRAGQVTRRTALKVIATAAAAAPAIGCGSPDLQGDPDGGTVDPGPLPDSNPLATGAPADPDLIAPSVPWEMKLSDAEMVTVRSLADIIIPADGRSPAASEVGAHDFVNEHVSAPYPANERDLVLVRGGLVWLDTESGARFGGAPFHELPVDRQRQICDDICYLADAAPEHRAAARFFDKMRDLVSTAFWTTEAGMQDLGYVGNVALPEFTGPPPEVLQRLGLDDA